MALLGKLFGRKDDKFIEMAWQPLAVPMIMESSRQIPIGPYTLQKHLGDLQQVRPPYKAQIWQGIDQEGESCSIGVIEPGEDKLKWLKERLGNVEIRATATYKVQGELRKLGTQLSVVVFHTVVAERFLIKKCLVSDPMQETYLAYDTKQNVPVYCTIHIPPKLASLPEKFISRLGDKPKKPKIQHPQLLEIWHEGICRPYGMFAAYRYKYPGLYYVITRYIEGVNFLHFLNQSKKKITAEQLGFIFGEMVQIIKYLQESGYYHGNIRPQTLWIGDQGEESGHLDLNGFSLLNLSQDQQTTAFSLLRNAGEYGCTTYMAPEQVSDVLEMKTDNFSIGMLFYMLIFGKSPLSTTDPRQALRQLSQWAFKSSQEIPPKFCWIIPTLEKLLQKNPQDRQLDWIAELDSVQEKYKAWSLQEAEEIVASPIAPPTEKPTEDEAKEQPTEEKPEESTPTDPCESPTLEMTNPEEPEEMPAGEYQVATAEHATPKQESSPIEFEEWEEVTPSTSPQIPKQEENKKSFFGRLFGSLSKGKKVESTKATKAEKLPEKTSEKKPSKETPVEIYQKAENDIEFEEVAEKPKSEKAKTSESTKNVKPEVVESKQEKSPSPDQKLGKKLETIQKTQMLVKVESAPNQEPERKSEPGKLETIARTTKTMPQIEPLSKKEKPKDEPTKEMVDIPSEDVADILNAKHLNEEDIEDLSEEELLDLAVGRASEQAKSKTHSSDKPDKLTTSEQAKSKTHSSDKPDKPSASEQAKSKTHSSDKPDKPSASEQAKSKTHSSDKPDKPSASEQAKSKTHSSDKLTPSEQESNANAANVTHWEEEWEDWQEAPSKGKSEEKSTQEKSEPKATKAKVEGKAKKPPLEESAKNKVSKTKPSSATFEASENMEVEDELDLEPEEIVASKAKVMPASVPSKSVAELQEQFKANKDDKMELPIKTAVRTDIPALKPIEITKPTENLASKEKVEEIELPKPQESKILPQPSINDKLIVSAPTEVISESSVAMLQDIGSALPALPSLDATPSSDATGKLDFPPITDVAWEKEFQMISNLQQWEEEEEEDIIGTDSDNEQKQAKIGTAKPKNKQSSQDSKK